jgi:PGF-pre-PGF domain-containing protein
VRRTLKINNIKHTNSVLNKKLLINFIVLFFVLELLLIPFTVVSITIPNGNDGGMNSSGLENNPPAVGGESSDSSSGTVVKDDSSTSSDSGTTVGDDSSSDISSGTTVDDDTITDTNDASTDTSDNTYTTNDKTSDSSDDSYVVDDNITDSSGSNLIADNTDVDSSGTSLLDDTSSYAPNERIVTTEEIVSKSENTLGDLASGIEKEVKIESSNDIESVKLTPATDLEEVKVTVIKLKDKPMEIIDPPKKNKSVYKYLDIKLISNETFIDEEEISSLEFNFKVEKTWIADNEIDKSTVKLIRYHDGVWQNLSTHLTEENETCIFYTAASPGFSTFAVVGSKIIEKSESYGSDDVSIPWSIIIAFVMTLTIMLVFILFKARYIYLKEDNK